MSEEPVISKELQSLLNVEFGPEVYEVEKGFVKRFAEAVDDPNPLWREFAPPTFPTALVPTALLHKVFNARSSLKRFLNGGNELEYFQPMRVGDAIAVTARLDRLRKMEGKEGTSLFMILEIAYRNQRGEMVAKGKSTFIRY